MIHRGREIFISLGPLAPGAQQTASLCLFLEAFCGGWARGAASAESGGGREETTIFCFALCFDENEKNKTPISPGKPLY